jgi:uncharacterized protein (DUF1501 family)
VLSRRRFLSLTGGAAVAGAATWAGLGRDHGDGASSGFKPATANRVLVVVQLSGGNDGLNTVVPHVGRYHDLRPTLGVADDSLVALKGESGVGLHPALQPLVPLWEAGRLAIVPGVGFASDSRSHFESLAAWWTASPEHAHTTGWIGRWLDASGVAADNPLAAISLGGGAVPALRADRSPSTAVNDLNGFVVRAPRTRNGDAFAKAFAATAAPVGDDPLLAAAQAAVANATRAVDVLGAAQSGGNAVEGDAPTTSDAGGPLTDGLAAAANLIGMDIGARVLLVSASGFDTHANQADTQQRLLGDLAGGISAFFAALEHQGQADRVLLLTTSEFGRRAAQNGSDGTDHGHGGVHFLAGHNVRGGLHGTVDVTNLADGDVAAVVDTRALYAAGLDWLGGPSADVLDGHSDSYGLVSA